LKSLFEVFAAWVTQFFKGTNKAEEAKMLSELEAISNREAQVRADLARQQAERQSAFHPQRPDIKELEDFFNRRQ
jgi:hypothetical protein